MRRVLLAVSSVVAILGIAGCGGVGSGGNGGSGSGGGVSLDVPTLNGIAPSSAAVGTPTSAILAYGSNLEDGAEINWNGTPLGTSCVDVNLTPTSCSNAAALSATVPASDFAAAGTATITLSNPASASMSGATSNPLSFTITQPALGNIWVRAVAGISALNDIVWDAGTGKLYASVGSTDPAHASTIAAVDPVAGTATSFVPAGSNPNLLSISSDGSYLWAGLDGSSSVQRFLLPGLSTDISFPLPKDWAGNPQQAVALQAAPVSPHTVALIPGHWGYSPAGDGVYVYDDATARPTSVPAWGAAGGPMIDWMQWGPNDSTIYGNQYTTIDAGGILTLKVDASGVTVGSLGNSLAIQLVTPQYDPSTGLLYSDRGAFNPVGPSLMGDFDLPTGAEACTADSTLGRYYCAIAYSDDGTDVTEFELWVFDLNSYALLNRVYFGASAGTSISSVSGRPSKLVRWGNAGLALVTNTWVTYGNGGIFLIDGAAVNPNATPDATGGTANASFAWLSSITPAATTTASGDVQVTITGSGFSPNSTACWNCSYLQFRFLPTVYVSPTQLNVTIPVGSVYSAEPLEISVYDGISTLFSMNALTFTVLPTSDTTQVTPVNLCGLSMAWDSNTQLLYVGTADYDGGYPNSIVAVDPTSGTIVKAQTVEPDPIFLTEGAQGEYLYAAYASATNLTQLSLPNLNTTVTAPLHPVQGDTWYPGDLKAAPQNPDTVAATMIMPGFDTEADGGIAVFDNGVPRPVSVSAGTAGQIYDTLAWSGSDQLLASAPSQWDFGETGPLYELQVDSSGASYVGQGTAGFDTAGGYLHSDFGTGLIYSDGGEVGDPNTGAIVGSYGASGLLAPDSSLNRVFILGQTSAQANTNNYTIDSFDEKAFTLVSSITLNNLSGTPIALARWGNSGLAVLTSGGIPSAFENGLGMLYIVQDAAFVSNASATPNVRKAKVERVQRRWKQMNIRDIVAEAHKAVYGALSESGKSIGR